MANKVFDDALNARNFVTSGSGGRALNALVNTEKGHDVNKKINQRLDAITELLI